MLRPPLLSLLVVALSLSACDSQMHLGGTPANAPLGVPATVSAGAAGQAVNIPNASALPSSLRQAVSLKAAFGSVKVPVSRNADGSLSFIIPPTAVVSQDSAGNLSVVLIGDDSNSQIVSLQTGPSITFTGTAITVTPSPANLAFGMSVLLNANTPADPSRYQFTWGYSSSGVAPFLPIGAQGKQVRWTPPAPGNYTLQVNAVDTQTQKTTSATTAGPLVLVSDDKGVITTSNTAFSRGTTTQLSFNPPASFTGTHLSYAWSYATSLQAPFTPLVGNSPQINWLPTVDGSYYVQVVVTNQDTGDVNTFTSPQPIVSVTETGPVIQASSPSANVGDLLSLSLNVPSPGNGPFAWYSSPSGGATLWTSIPGNTSKISYIPTASGSFNFRVDVPQPDGTIQSLTTNTPILSVIQPTPIITVSPTDASVTPGSSVNFTLNAQGIDAGYRFNWFVSTNPSFGFTSLPGNSSANVYSKTYNWAIPATQAPGSYYVRVDAVQRQGTNTYSFVSSTPLLNVTTSAFSAP
jgi:hypothetical protein